MKHCDICGTEITDRNQSDEFSYGCMDCDRTQRELKDYAEDPFDYYEERLIEEAR